MAAPHESAGLLMDTHVWFAGSFVTFVILAFVFGRKAILGKLDGRIAEIRNEIQTAENLHREAQNLLTQYQIRHEEAVRDAAKIKAEAEKDAEKIRTKAEADMQDAMERREKQLEERLARMKQSAIAEIQQYAADLAAAATAEIIAKKLDKKSNEKLVDHAINKIGENLH
jgi:F-type H+-transporting ATPase subunit b